MRTISLKASLMAGLTHVVNTLTPEQKAKAHADPVEGNRLILKAVADVEAANKDFMDAAKATFDRKSAALEAAKERMKAAQDGKSPEESARIGSEANKALKAECDAIDKESVAQPDVIVAAQLSDEKLEALRKVFPLTVSLWQDSAAFVETADALENAE